MQTINSLKSALNKSFLAELPGAGAQMIMAPAGRKRYAANFPETKEKKSAVLVLFYPTNDVPHLLLTQRQDYEGIHANQVSFPGGKMDEQDPDLSHTALREAMEETGLNPGQTELLGELTPLYIPVSGFSVYPYVGIYKTEPRFLLNQREVKEIVPFTVEMLCNPLFRGTHTVSTLYGKLEAPCFLPGNHIIWGATAMIMSELAELLRPHIDKSF